MYLRYIIYININIFVRICQNIFCENKRDAAMKDSAPNAVYANRKLYITCSVLLRDYQAAL